MKKIVLLLVLISTISFAELKKIELKKIKEPESSGPILKIKTKKEIQKVHKYKKIKLKRYNVKYDHSYDEYSVINTDKKNYKSFLNQNNIPKPFLKKIFMSTDTPLSTITSAVGFDWVSRKPYYAENFYKLINKKDYSMQNKIITADYFLRTGQIKKIPTLLNETDCLANITYTKDCMYYLGLYEYLTTGKNKNSYLRIAKDKHSKAKEIYYGK
jgi:hypothetical protein